MNKNIYRIQFLPSVLKDIRRLPQNVLTMLQTRIDGLAEDPFPQGVMPIKGYDKHYRIRIGQYRIVYAVETTIRIITVIRIGHRKDVYRKL